MKGHRKLAAEHVDKRQDYIGHRHVTRLQADMYGRGITRSQQESNNLRATGLEGSVTSSEFFSTSGTVPFPGVDVCKWREAFYENAKTVDIVSAVGIDWRNPKRRTHVVRNLVFLYGHRPRFIDDNEAKGVSPLWHLSLYEFLVYWIADLSKYTLNAGMTVVEQEQSDDLHAVLRPEGRQKLMDKLPLAPGTDYRIKETWSSQGAWATLPATTTTNGWRHDWIFARRVRPVDSYFARCPMPREGLGHQEQNAVLILSYFHPFSLHAALSDKHVPHLNQLRNAGLSWQETLMQWFDGQVLRVPITTIPGPLKLREEQIGYMVHWKRDYSSRIPRSLVAPLRGAGGYS